MMFALAILTLASCSKNNDVYDSNADIVKDKYNQVFTNYVGGNINPKQDWGFSANTRGTRSVDTNANEWMKKGYVVPEDITAREIEVVSNWFKNNQNPDPQSHYVTDFFVQNVYHGDHTYTTTKDKNGFTHDIVGSEKMDYISCMSKENNWEHINNFNAKSGEIQHLLNSGTQSFSYHDSYANFTSYKFCLRAISVDGVVGYYVGFDYETKKDDGSEYPGDGYYDDRIVKIVPGVIVPTGDIRIIAEDLSAGQGSDFDFNDIVLDVKLAPANQLILKAAGGTLPLRIAGNDEWEVHKLFGVDVKDMVNTGDGPTKDPVVIDYNNPINNAAEAKNIKLEVYIDGKWHELKAEQGEPASKICVDYTFKWLKEHKSIKEEFPLFVDWVHNAEPNFIWW